MALAMEMDWAFMPKVSVPNQLPVRPKPQITSSAMKRMSYLARMALTFSK